jgi:hypothetical protein
MNLKYPKYHFLRVLLSFIVFLFFTLHWDWGIYSIIVEITLNFLYFCFYIYLALTILLLLYSFLESLLKRPLTLLYKLTFLLLIYLFWIIWLQSQDYATFPTNFEIVFDCIILMLFGIIFFANPAFLSPKSKNN